MASASASPAGTSWGNDWRHPNLAGSSDGLAKQTLEISERFTEDDVPQVIYLIDEYSNACDNVVLLSDTLSADRTKLVKFAVDSAATTSVVNLMGYLSLLTGTKLPTVASAAGDITATAKGILETSLGRMKHKVILEAIYMPSCPVNVLSIPQLKAFGFGFSFDTQGNGTEDSYILTPRDRSGKRAKIPLDIDPMTGLFYTTVTIRVEKGSDVISSAEESILMAMTPYKILLTVLGPDLDEPVVKVYTAASMQLLHERMGHISFDTLRKLQGTVRNLKIPGGFSTLPPCHICDAIKVQKSKWPLHSEMWVSLHSSVVMSSIQICMGRFVWNL